MDNGMKRFETKEHVALDRRSGLMWPTDAALGEFPMAWHEALDYLSEINRNRLYGFADWRLPNRRELFSLVCHKHINPSLPEDHPFANVFSGYYWTGTTCARLPDQAWYLHLGGARVFKGMKHGFYMVWPVRTADVTAAGLPYRTGQRICYAKNHQPHPCAGLGQDGEIQAGRPWPQPRFEVHPDGVLDRLSGLVWDRCANRSEAPVDWSRACEAVAQANQDRYRGHETWRLPTVRDMESLCDLNTHSPALPDDHPFDDVQSDYWTASISRYEPSYAWVLYLRDGAVGVGFKAEALFSVWLVRDEMEFSPSGV